MTKEELLKDFHKIPNQDHTAIKSLLLKLIDWNCVLEERILQLERDRRCPTGFERGPGPY